MPKNPMKDAIVDAEEGSAECHYCMRIVKKTEMQRQRDRNAVRYTCPECQPK